MVVSEETLEKVMEFCNMKKRNQKAQPGSLTASSQGAPVPENAQFEFGDFIRAFKVSHSILSNLWKILSRIGY